MDFVTVLSVKLKNLIMETAKEIADDVQQTFDDVTCSYRQVLEDRIIDYTKRKCKEQRKICTNEFMMKTNLDLNFDIIENAPEPEFE